jgi:DNA-binding transcriptional ArsR family regulator
MRGVARDWVAILKKTHHHIRMREYKNANGCAILKEKAELLRLLGHPTRLAIVRRLAKGPCCVSDIQELLGVPQANISQHLTALRSKRVVDYHEDGKLRCYYVTRPTLATLVLRVSR